MNRGDEPDFTDDDLAAMERATDASAKSQKSRVSVEQAAEMSRRMEASPDPDFWAASFAAALDETKGDVVQSMQLADEAAKQRKEMVG
jgi:hypothetical protein